jgi:hypothetical protein
VHVDAFAIDVQLPIARGGVRATIAASAMHPSISLLAETLISGYRSYGLFAWPLLAQGSHAFGRSDRVSHRGQVYVPTGLAMLVQG